MPQPELTAYDVFNEATIFEVPIVTHLGEYIFPTTKESAWKHYRQNPADWVLSYFPEDKTLQLSPTGAFTEKRLVVYTS